MPILYIIQGFIGSGKTTFSKLLSDYTGTVRLNADEWVAQNIPQKQQETQWDACFAKAITTLWLDTESLLDARKSVILDFGFWTKETRDHARARAKTYQADLKHIYLSVPDAVLIERLKRRDGAIAQRNLENFHSLKASFEPPTASENPIVIHNDGDVNFNQLTRNYRLSQ